MSRIITLIAAVGAALAVAVPSAWGTGQPDARSDGLNRMYGLGEYSPEIQALKLRSEGLNERYGLGKWASSSVNSIDARERGMTFRAEDPTTAMLDAREEAFEAVRDVRLSAGTPPDVFERAVAARGTGSGDHFVANDNRVGIEPTSQPARVSVTGSGNDIEWPQVGIGFGVGITLILGLLLGLRATRQRPLAH